MRTLTTSLIAFCLCVGLRAQNAGNNGLVIHTGTIIAGAITGTSGLLASALGGISGIPNTTLNGLDANGNPVGPNGASGTVAASVSYEGNTGGISVSWNFTTDSNGDIWLNYTVTEGAFTVKTGTHNIDTGIAANLLNSTANPNNYVITNQVTGNQTGNGQGIGTTYTVQVVIDETWDPATGHLTDTVQYFTYFVPSNVQNKNTPITNER